MGTIKSISIREQGRLSDEDLSFINSLGVEPTDESSEKRTDTCLGLNKDGFVSYFVGATWLKEGECSLSVLPKFKHLDFMSILYETIHCGVHPDYFKSVYKVDYGKPQIEEPALQSVLTPIIVTHYLCVIKRLLEKGLKRNYVLREENLKGKVKGHIMTLKNLQKNVISGHAERVLCRYQDYSADYPENQLLKRALLAAESMLVSLDRPNNQLLSLVRKQLKSFVGVNHNITPSGVKNIRKDKLHGDYPLAIQLAKLILKRAGLSIYQNDLNYHFVPVFSIDMSKIFEFHVLSILMEIFGKEDVLFQVNTKSMGICDYLILSKQLIVDAKYKRGYDNRKMCDKLSDVREVAGYGRSEYVLNMLRIPKNMVPNCLIIYPNGYGTNNLNNPLLEYSKPMNEVANFYTLSVKLPKQEP